jgi:hypothetical protein
MRNPFWTILGFLLLVAVMFFAGCATETSYQTPENRFEYKYYRPPTSGGAMIGPPPEAGG